MFVKNTFLVLVIGGQCMPLVPMGSKTQPKFQESENWNVAVTDSGRPTTSNQIIIVDSDTWQPVSVSINARLPHRDDTYMHMVAATGTWEKLDWLVCKRGGDLDARTVTGDTPLHVAVANGKLLNVGCLLANGANPRACNGYGVTPLTLAQHMYGNKSDKGSRLMVAMLEFFAAHA